MSSGAVEPQSWGEIKPGLGAEIVQILEARNGVATFVLLQNGLKLEAYDCSWGRDVGDFWEHITLNAGSSRPAHMVHFVKTAEITGLVDPITGQELYIRSAM